MSYTGAGIALAVKHHLSAAGVIGLRAVRGRVQGVPGFDIRCYVRLGGLDKGSLFRLRQAAEDGNVPVVIHPAGAVESDDLSVTMRLVDFAPMFAVWLESQGLDVNERRKNAAAQRQRRRRLG